MQKWFNSWWQLGNVRVGDNCRQRVWNKALCWWLCLLCEIKDKEDTLKLQRDIDRLGNWARKWGMIFQPVKCNMMQLTRKRLNKIQASYTLEGTALENVDNIKYLGVTITTDLKWNMHISNICTKANRTLGFLRRTLFSCPQNVKETAYKGMVRPILEYGSSFHTNFQASIISHVQWLHSPVCVGPGQKPRRLFFSLWGSYIFMHFLTIYVFFLRFRYEEPCWEKNCLGFTSRPDTNQAVQLF